MTAGLVFITRCDLAPDLDHVIGGEHEAVDDRR